MRYAAMAFGLSCMVIAFRECGTLGRVFLSIGAAASIIVPFLTADVRIRAAATCVLVVLSVGAFFYVRIQEIRSKLCR